MPRNMPEQKGQDSDGKSKKTTSQDLAQQVAERVWELWREELRHEGERVGKMNRS